MNGPISIIILNYNGKQYLKECLNSVFAQSYTDFEVILFDNNSSDGSVEYLRSEFLDKRLKVVESAKNLGFAGGNNEALKHCGNDLVVLLNNDTITDKDWLLNLAAAAGEKNTIASSFVITKGVPDKYYETNGSVSYLMYNIMNIFPDREDEFYPNGCSLIFRKSEIGEPFDPDYFYYGEDTYLGLKARFMGMRIKFAKDSIVHHLGGGSETANSFKTFCQERNRFLNLYIFFSIGFIVRMIPYITFNHIMRLVTSIFSKRRSFGGTLKALIWFYLNIPAVLRKRREIALFKTKDEAEVIKFMSSKVFNEGSRVAGFFNSVSYLYSRLTGIKPIEYYIKNGIPFK